VTPDSFRLWILALVCFEIVIVTFAAISLSSSAIAKEREDGSLDLLLTTSITPKIYLGGKVRGLTMHILPMVLVPCITMMAVGCMVLIDPSGAVVQDQLVGSNAFSEVPLALVAPAILTPFVVFPYIAFCISLGLLWSMRSKGSISAMVSSLILILVVTGGLGMCLIPSSEMGHIGSFFAAMSPVNAVRSTLMSVDVIPSVISEGVATANVSLAISSVIAGIVWSLISMGLLRSMSASFVVTVRRLAGIN
jgi:ABC-type Na+ efflux pump permease subunit